jgi:carbonyl reductase 1
MNDGGRIVSVSSTASHLQSFGSDLQKRFRAAADIEEIDALTNEFIAATKNERANKDGWASPYCVSKACINAMTAVFAKENPKLFVNCCCPGVRRTLPLS